jgi:hypothetical protein
MQSLAILCHKALVRTDVSEERIASIIRVFLRGVLQLLVIANIVPSSLILSTMLMEELRSTETSVLTRTTRRHIPKHCILHSHRREKLKSYIELFGWAL